MVKPLSDGKQLWRTDEQLLALEKFALADDRRAAVEGEGGRSPAVEDALQRLLLKALSCLQRNDTTAFEVAMRQAKKENENHPVWTPVIEEFDLLSQLKSWDDGDTSKRQRALKSLKSLLKSQLSRHEQDASYRQRAEALGEREATKYPSSLMEGRSVSATVEKKLEEVLENYSSHNSRREYSLTGAAVVAVMNTPALVTHLMSKHPGSIDPLLCKLPVPTPPGLATLVSANLTKAKDSSRTYERFTLRQMWELTRSDPQLLGDTDFLKQMAEQLLHNARENPEATSPTVSEYVAFVDSMEPVLAAAPPQANWLRHICLRTRLRLQRKQRGWVDARTLGALLRLPWLHPTWPMRNDRRLRGHPKAAEEAEFCDCNTLTRSLSDDMMGEVSRSLVDQWLLDAVMSPIDGGAHHFEGDGCLAGLLEQKEADSVVAKGMLLSGKGDQADWAAAFKAAGGSLGELSSQVILRFAPDCESEFLPGGDVTLKAEVKNCQHLIVKVFEINAWNYCREMRHSVREDIELEGLSATHSFSVNLPEQGPLRSSRVDIPLPQLGDERGEFVVELLGGGLASRALLRIGRLAAVEDITPAGHSFLVFWEDGTPADGAKVCVEQTVYQQEGAQAGFVLVPFADEALRGQERVGAVLGCAQSSMGAVMKFFEQRTEVYELSASMAIEPESMWSTGQATAPLTVSARLFLHGTPVPVSLLREAKVTVTTEEVDGTSRKQKVLVSAEELQRNREWLSLQVPVALPEQLQRMSARLEAQVAAAWRRDMATGEAAVQHLSVERDWDAGACHRTRSLFDMHLGRDASGFVLTVRGRAGEPAAGAHVNVSLLAEGLLGNNASPELNALLPSEFRFESGFVRHLQTDVDGCIRLGPLPHITNVWATLTQLPNSSHVSQRFEEVQRTWDLSPMRSGARTHLPKEITLMAASDKPVRIPFAAPEEPHLTLFGVHLNSAAWPVLLATSNEWTTFMRKEVFVTDETVACVSTTPGYAELTNVPAGLHRLYLSHDTWVSVRAVPSRTAARLPPLVRQPCGTRWLLARCAAHALHESHPLTIISFTANVAAGVTLQLAGSPAQLASARVTITLSRFLPPDHSHKQPLAPLAACAPLELPSGSPGLEMLDTPSAGKLVPERQLSEEVQYVMARRAAALNSTQPMGTVLQPPSLLVHPVRLCEAGTKDVQLSNVGGMRERCHDGMRTTCGMAGSDGMHFGNYPSRDGSMDPRVPYLGFVLPPVTVFDLCPSADGLVTLSADAVEEATGGVSLEDSGFGFVTAAVLLPSGHVLTTRAAVEGCCGVEAAPTLSPAVAPSKGGDGIQRRVETRRAVVLEPGGCLPLPVASEGNSLKCEAFDCLPKVWELLDSLMGIEECSGRSDWAAFDIVSRWHSLPRAKKLAALAEHRCHELHFFVAINDAPLFGDTLRPAIAAKSREEWRFMDAWLALWPVRAAAEWDAAEAEAFVLEWGSPTAYSRLTRAEKILISAVADGCRLLRRDEGTGKASELRDLSVRLAPSQRLRESEGNRKMSLRRFMATLAADSGEQRIAAPIAKRVATEARSALHDQIVGSSGGRGRLGYAGDVCFDDGILLSEGAAGRRDDWDEMLSCSSSEVGTELGEDDGGWDDVEDNGDEDWWQTVTAARAKAALTHRFQRPGQMVQWVEGGYYRQGRAGEEREPAPLEPNSFWSDVCLQLAARLEAGVAPFGAPLLSQYLTEQMANPLADAGRGGAPSMKSSAPGDTPFSRALMGVAMMALPQKAACRRSVSPPAFFAGPSSPAVVFVKETLEVDDEADLPGGINIVRSVTLPDTQPNDENATPVDGPLVAGCVYRYRVILSSALPSAAALDVLIPLPEGSMPVAVGSSKVAGGAVHVNLQPYCSHKLESLFYFPYALGEGATARQFPVTAASSLGKLLACSTSNQPLQVFARPVPTVPRSDGEFDWKELSQGGTDQEVLRFLESGNICEDGVKLEQIAWRARRSPEFAREAAAHLRNRRVFCKAISMYALRHGKDEQTLREFLEMNPKVVATCGPYADTPLLQLRPQACGFFHLELWPFVNPRAHELPRSSAASYNSALLFSPDLKNAWGSLLSVIARQADGPTFHQSLAVVYYLILQGRLTEAHARLHACSLRFSDTDEAQLGAGLQMQRRYMEAWLGLRLPGAQTAEFMARTRAACEAYLAPDSSADADPRWRQLWNQLSFTIAELQDVLAGGSGIEVGAHGEGDAAKVLEPMLKARRLDDWQMEVVAEGLEEAIEVRLFPMDAEVMFSTNAFALSSQDSEADWRLSEKELGKFAFVAPCAVIEVAPPGKTASARTVVDIRAALPKMEQVEVVMVQLASGTSTFRLPMYTSTMRVRSSSTEGVLYVKRMMAPAEADGSEDAIWKPLPAAYCKVHARYSDHREEFYKDGYTDCLGRFDYASLTGQRSSGAAVAKMAALVVSQEGCTIIQMDPPRGM